MPGKHYQRAALMGKFTRFATRFWCFRWTGVGTTLAVGIGLYGAIIVAHNSQSALSAKSETSLALGPMASARASKIESVTNAIAQLQIALKTTEKSLVEHQKSNSADRETPETILRQTQDAMSKLETLDTDHALLQSRRDQLQLQLAEVPRKNPIKPTLAQKNLAALLKKLEALYKQYPDGHPDVTAMERLVLKARKAAESDTRGARSRNIVEINPVYEQLQKQIRSVTEKMEGVHNQSKIQSEKIVKLRSRLERRAAVPRERQLLRSRLEFLSQNLHQKRELLNVLNTPDPGAKMHAGPLTTPAEAVPLQHGKMIPAVLAAALSAGLGATFLRAKLSSTFYTLKDLEGAFALPVLGTVSRVKQAALRPNSIPNPPGTDAHNQEFTLDVDRLQAHGLIATPDDQSPLGKEVRLIKRRLLRRMSAPRTSNSEICRGREHVILVISARVDESKGLLAVNLALSMVLEDGLNVLLIDADANAARPSLDALIGARSGPGLGDFLTTTPPVMSKVILEERNHPLTFLPAGNAAGSAINIYSDANACALIVTIAKRYRDRVIIINGPPLSVSTEPPDLTGQVGQTMMAIDAENASRTSVEKALGRMKTHDNVTLVLNNTLRD